MDITADRKKYSRTLAVWSIRLVLGLTFIWASWHKILAPDEFARIIYGYGVFPGPSINLLAIGLPYIELLAGLCLIAGVYRRPALIIINAMLLGFSLVIAFNLIRGHQFDCGCFSFEETSGTLSAAWLLVRDLVMLAAGTWLWRLWRREEG